MLFDPLEEQLDLPSRLVNVGNSPCWQREVVSKEYQYSSFGITVFDPSDSLGIGCSGVKACEHNRLVAD